MAGISSVVKPKTVVPYSSRKIHGSGSVHLDFAREKAAVLDVLASDAPVRSDLSPTRSDLSPKGWGSSGGLP
jgi:hypothetical protein